MRWGTTPRPTNDALCVGPVCLGCQSGKGRVAAGALMRLQNLWGGFCMLRTAWLVKALVLTFCVHSGAVTLQAATIHHVDANAPGTNDCSDWLNACHDLQDALTLAEPGDQIWVAQGTYRPDFGTGNRKGTFQLKSGVAIYGGFLGNAHPLGGETSLDQRDPKTNVTTLSGDINGDDAVPCTQDTPDCDSFGGTCISGFCIQPENDENSHNVVTGSGTDTTAVLDGFVITAGNADGPFGGIYTFGAGMINENGSPTVRNCVFEHNIADFGGAMFNTDAAATVIDCVFDGNEATYGGAISNQAPDTGAAAPTLINCLFINNTANFGGAIINWSNSNPVLTNCTLSGNTSLIPGGAGGIENMSGSPTLTNCILWGNSAAGVADAAAQIHTKVGVPIVNHSCVQGGWGGTGADNIADDPGFVDAPGSDLHLQGGSPCIDTGDNGVVTVAIDLDGNARIIDGTVDMGAYEFLPAMLVSSTPSDGYIDPRNTDGIVVGPTRMIDEITMSFSTAVRNTDGSALSAGAFVVTSTGASPPTVVSIDDSANPIVVVTLSGHIEIEHWTTLAANVESFTGVETTAAIDIGFLPGDANQSGNVNILDVAGFALEFDGLARPELIDLNRTGTVNVLDVAELAAIFNGGASGTALPLRP